MEPDRQLRGGVDLGGTKIEAIVVDANDEVVGQSRQPTPTDGGPADVVAQMGEALNGAAENAGGRSSDLLGVGVGSPGDVDEQTGVVANARNLPGWQGPFGVAAALSEQLGTKVFVGNDVQVATQAEFELGAGKPHQAGLGVFWGPGVGGGRIREGKQFRVLGGAGEFRPRVVRRNGTHCPWWRRG